MTAQIDGLSVVPLLSREVAQGGAFYSPALGLPLQEEQHDGRHRQYACRLGTVYFTIQPAANLGGAGPGPPLRLLAAVLHGRRPRRLPAALARSQRHWLHAPQRFEHTTFVNAAQP
jgi:hypothetical protein